MKYMSCSRHLGPVLGPLFLFFFLIAASAGSIAQNAPAGSEGGQPSPPEGTQSTGQSAQPENPIANQIRLAREARARIAARRRARRDAAIHDTYSHKYEIYGGGGYLRFRPGSALQHINETAWNVGFSDYLRPRIAATGEIRGYYGTAFIGNNEFSIFKPAVSQYVFLGGPQYRFVQRVHWAISGQVLGGAAKGIFNGNSANFPGTLLGLWPNGTTFAIGAAVPIDYNLGPSLAFRISPNYLYTHFGGTAQVKGLGFTAGLVVRFGRH